MANMRRKCKKCGKVAAVRITYGMLSVTGSKQLHLSGGVYGGDVIEDDSPKWACRECGYKWGVVKIGISA